MAPTGITSRVLASRRRRCEQWIEENVRNGSIRRLVRVYWHHPIVLYTGAGVSTGPAEELKGKRYGLPTWPVLLRQIAGRLDAEKWPSDPWKAADKAVRLSGGRRQFKRRLKQLIETEHFYTGKYGQLCATFVGQAPTLNAVAAFCGQITGRIKNPREPQPSRIHYRSAANPRIHAVLTANYDCFLESAASNLYRRSPLQPVTALGSVAGSTTRIPVFHVHGYVPHPFYQRDDRKPTIDELIITRKDYDEHWKPHDVFGTTMGPQIHYLRYFTVLFIGFSFADEYVCELLRRVYNDYLCHAGRSHFALVKDSEVEDKGMPFFKEMGIEPIVYSDYDEIPSLLATVYRAGLVTDRIVAGETTVNQITQVTLPEFRTRESSPTAYRYGYSHDDIWNLMMALRNESVAASKVRNVERRYK